MTRSYEEFDYSGDIGIEVWGSDMSDVLKNATMGLFSLMCQTGVRETVERRIEVSSTSPEDLLVDWLGEVISTGGAHGEIYAAVEIVHVGEWHAEGILRGEPVDAGRHDLRFDVKAATYHGLAVEKREDGYYGRVIFDL